MCKHDEEKEKCCCHNLKKMLPAYPIVPFIYPIGVGMLIGLCGVYALHKIACSLNKIIELKEKE